MDPRPVGVALYDAPTVASALGAADWLAAAEEAFRRHGRDGKGPMPLAVHLPAGGIHIKAAALPEIVSVKINANLPGNPTAFGLPTIQGLVVVVDAERGSPLAVVDSASLTAQRTAAATAVAVRTLSRADATTLALIGCGVQGRAHLALVTAARRFARVVLFDTDSAAARRLAAEAWEIEVTVAGSLAEATADADVVVTNTPSHEPILALAQVRPGCLVAAVGADHPEKRELADDLLRAASLVVDDRTQTAAIGEWHHLREAHDQPAELGEILRGERSGRSRDDQIIVFDSTGLAVQDTCALARLLGRARTPATRFDFARRAG